MSVDDVRDAYGRRAEEYADLFASTEAMDERDRKLVSQWAGELTGRIIDAGCGPGQWTDFLQRQGCDVEGVDLVPGFVDIARARFPGVSYRVGELDDLGVPDRSLAGILSWYSIIHTHPDDVPRILAEFARCLCDGGGLVLGMFEGPALEPFDHAVTTAYYWSFEEMSKRLGEAGFEVEATESRQGAKRLEATVVARRVGVGP
ncbi:class I SAM-dependent DNA methyltransferase [Kribbella sp. NPDC050124]|uniref:class I SAM-dependent DNA methyltransferase n=1 Tax=Kribbella sp. NPDC050124 TaxID=3364114 RepID=UPI00379F6E95